MTEVTLIELKTDSPVQAALHEFGTPYSGTDSKCTEADADLVEFGLNDGFLPHENFAGVCAPKAADGTCPAADHPADYKLVPAAIKDTVGDATHCQLVCTTDTDCVVKDSKCLAVTIGDKDQMMCLFKKVVTPTPVPTVHHKFGTPYSGTDSKCSETDADVVEFGLKNKNFAGVCAPKAAADGTCPAADHPADYKLVPAAIKDTVGDATHCQLVCTKDTDCVVKDSKCLTVTIGDKDQMMCLFNKAPTPVPTVHHKFETPYPTKEGDAPKCTEAGTDVVEFDTSDGKKAGICAPKPQDSKCPSDDFPEGSTAVPKSITDAGGPHCELDCSKDEKCPGSSKCTSVKTIKSKLFAMRLDDGGDCKICLYEKTNKNAFLMS